MAAPPLTRAGGVAGRSVDFATAAAAGGFDRRASTVSDGRPDTRCATGAETRSAARDRAAVLDLAWTLACTSRDWPSARPRGGDFASPRCAGTRLDFAATVFVVALAEALAVPLADAAAARRGGLPAAATPCAAPREADFLFGTWRRSVFAMSLPFNVTSAACRVRRSTRTAAPWVHRPSRFHAGGHPPGCVAPDAASAAVPRPLNMTNPVQSACT